jgi:hypothetical protein
MSQQSLMDFIKSIESKSLSDIRQEAFKNHIQSSYDPNDGRMVFYTSKNARFDKVERKQMWSECNGYVVDTVNMKPLVIPMCSFKSNVNTNILNTNLVNDVYDIYKVEDGTVISLYWWESASKWCISTTRGYDVSEVKWGTKTYTHILKELVELYGTDVDTFYNSLNKEHCYTFGFKHKSMHPFKEGKKVCINKLWFIQSVELKTNCVNENFQFLFGISNQEKFVYTKENINSKYLFSKLHTSLNDFILTGNVCYGFILKPKNTSSTNINNIIMLESSLLQNIRKLIYHRDLNKYANEMGYNKDLTTIIHAYLNPNICDLFITLFPQHEHIYDDLNIVHNTIVNNVIKYNDVKYKTFRQINNRPKVEDIKPNPYMDDIIEYICEKINRKFMDIKNKHIKHYVSSYIKTVKFVHVFYNMILVNCNLSTENGSQKTPDNYVTLH